MRPPSRIITSQKVELFFACLLLLDVLILFTDLGELEYSSCMQTGARHFEK
jgi:hypothetical protein